MGKHSSGDQLGKSLAIDGAVEWVARADRSVAGLVLCYTQAIPFFRYTLTGDLLFAFMLFGGYALAVQLGFAARTQPALAAE